MTWNSNPTTIRVVTVAVIQPGPALELIHEPPRGEVEREYHYLNDWIEAILEDERRS